MATKSLSIEQFLASLAAKNPTPGGGAAAAIGASVGSAAASMAAAYTQRKKDVESGAAEQARALIATLEVTTLLQAADDDAVAYSDLQRTWNKELEISADEKTAIEARALAIPTTILEDCHSRIHQIYDFLPHCNPNITSDAKVGIHQLAGAARAAYQVSINEKIDCKSCSPFVDVHTFTSRLQPFLYMRHANKI
jgi:formiminotetrahydrofolate cyclodeaminase